MTFAVVQKRRLNVQNVAISSRAVKKITKGQNWSGEPEREMKWRIFTSLAEISCALLVLTIGAWVSSPWHSSHFRFDGFELPRLETSYDKSPKASLTLSIFSSSTSTVILQTQFRHIETNTVILTNNPQAQFRHIEKKAFGFGYVDEEYFWQNKEYSGLLHRLRAIFIPYWFFAIMTAVLPA